MTTMPRRILNCILGILLLLAALGPAVGAFGPASESAGFHLLRSDARGIVFSFRGPPLQIELVRIGGQLYHRPRLPGYGHATRPGEPQLPQAEAWLAIPAGAQLKITVRASETETLSGYRIPPVPSQEPVLSGLRNNPLSPPAAYRTEYTEDGAVYGASGFFPRSLAEASGPILLRDQTCVLIRLYPVQYDPAKARVRYYRYLEVHISLEYPEVKGLPPRQESSAFEAILQEMLLNGESAVAWREPPRGQPRLAQALADYRDPPAYKVQTSQQGIHCLTYSDLLAAGVPVGSLEPRTLQMFNKGREIAIYITGDGDGRFDTGDKIYFFAEKQNTKYTGTNVYWLIYGKATGSRMAEKDGTPSGFASIPASFTDTYHLETNALYLNELPGSDELERWIWNYVLATTTPRSRTYQAYLHDVAAGAHTAHIDAQLVGWTYDASVNPDHHARIYVNGNLVGEQWWDGQVFQLLSFDFPQSYLVSGTNSIVVELPADTGSSLELVLIDWFDIRYQREYQAQGDVLFFGGDAAGNWEYQVDGFSSEQLMVFDITDPLRPQRVANLVADPDSAYVLRFEDTVAAPARYVALTQTACLSPASIALDTPSDLRNPSNRADYIVITPRDFWAEAERLADYRQQAGGWQTMLVDVQDVYDEFNDGLAHPEAMHDFLAYAYENWQAPAPSFVVLFGDGHYDPKNHLGISPPSYIPPWLRAVDPYIVETAADESLVMVSGDDLLPDMHLGRFPVNSLAEAKAMVDKVVEYEQNPAPGDWISKLLFVADNADAGGPFEYFSDLLIADYVHPPYAADTVYVRDCIAYIGPVPDPTECRNEIRTAINEGRLLVNFIGHGAVHFWTSERIWRSADIATLSNEGKYPIMLPLTCSEGYYVHPTLASLSETNVRAEGKGAIASWTAAGFGLITGHDYFNRGFLNAVLLQGERTMGLATMAGKLKLFQEAHPDEHFHLLTYLLLGDPALHLQNQPPESLAVSPDAGWSPPGPTQPFAATYRDGNSWRDIRYAYFLVNTAADTAGGVYARYDRQADRLHLWDASQGFWVGGYAPGEAATISTANGELDVAQCAVQGVTNTLTVTFALAFKEPMAGTTYNQYLNVEDADGAASGWQQRGTWHISLPPRVESLAMDPPYARPWTTQYFTARYTFAPLDWGEIADAYLLINHTTDAAYGVLLWYDQNADLLYLRNDEDTAWLGGYAPDSPHEVENGQVTLKVDESNISGGGSELEVRWALAFKPGFIGWRRNVYVRATDDKGGAADWEWVGVWKVR